MFLCLHGLKRKRKEKGNVRFFNIRISKVADWIQGQSTESNACSCFRKNVMVECKIMSFFCVL